MLAREVIDGLAVRADGVYVDGTFGRGGHSRLIANGLGEKGRLIVLDRDPQAIAEAMTWRDRESGTKRIEVIQARFSELDRVLNEFGVDAVDGVLLDLGVSSPQLDEAERGFSFLSDGPLDMRMNPAEGQPVSEWLQSVSEQELATVLRDYGDERFAFPVAKAIVARCRDAGRAPLTRTRELSELVADVIRRRQKKPEVGKNPATRTFQALRIHTNREIAELSRVLGLIPRLLAPKGRLAVISFHSLEDRIVKQFIARHSGRSGERHPVTGALVSPVLLKDMGRFLPGDAECASNPRARSSVLRVAERTDVVDPAHQAGPGEGASSRGPERRP